MQHVLIQSVLDTTYFPKIQKLTVRGEEECLPPHFHEVGVVMRRGKKPTHNRRLRSYWFPDDSVFDVGGRRLKVVVEGRECSWLRTEEGWIFDLPQEESDSE